MYFDVLFPIWGVQGTVAILVTTPPKEDGPFLDLLYKTHPKTGEKLVLDYVKKMICSRCEKRNPGARSCKHIIKKYTPDHKSGEKADIAQILYRDPESYNREYLYVYFLLTPLTLIFTGVSSPKMLVM